MSEGGVADGAALNVLWADAAARTRLAIEGVTHDLSLKEPPAGLNCINWVAGHVVAGRSNCLAMLGASGGWSVARLRPYLPNQPRLVPDSAIAWEEIVPALRETHEALAAAFAAATPESLCVQVEDGPLGVALARYAQHESFHAGQLEMLRALVG